MLVSFGLQTPQEDSIGKPCIESIRSARRIGPDGQILFDIVAEISQRRISKVAGKDRSCRSTAAAPSSSGRRARSGMLSGSAWDRNRSVTTSSTPIHESHRGQQYWAPEEDVLRPNGTP